MERRALAPVPGVLHHAGEKGGVVVTPQSLELRDLAYTLIQELHAPNLTILLRHVDQPLGAAIIDQLKEAHA
ncbi:MAG: hypothetical protein C7B46_20000 [Sulfobacillus benefaciens]|uniref:Uncharacterized protein n=1 Tax=Sulfobacillus benefaciens TaxID=453960 RepID=A0A2T2WW17_9FIRM|nr:MAG: hypothetical protein C7B46_20000 [Sulfobacillus benefaciens]